jgi:RNA recognition motif-containing protein
MDISQLLQHTSLGEPGLSEISVGSNSSNGSSGGSGSKSQQRFMPVNLSIRPAPSSVPPHSVAMPPSISMPHSILGLNKGSHGQMGGHSPSLNQNPHPVSIPSHEVFVGNLSYFCQEHDLFALFDEYAHVKNVRIVWNEDRSRPLMYGFVLLANQHEVFEMKKLLDGHLFMGRPLR